MIMTVACQHVHNVYICVKKGYLTSYSFMFYTSFFVEFTLIKQILPLKKIYVTFTKLTLSLCDVYDLLVTSQESIFR